MGSLEPGSWFQAKLGGSVVVTWLLMLIVCLHSWQAKGSAAVAETLQDEPDEEDTAVYRLASMIDHVRIAIVQCIVDMCAAVTSRMISLNPFSLPHPQQIQMEQVNNQESRLERKIERERKGDRDCDRVRESSRATAYRWFRPSTSNDSNQSYLQPRAFAYMSVCAILLTYLPQNYRPELARKLNIAPSTLLI